MPDLLTAPPCEAGVETSAPAALRRVLFVCYHFPPVGGAGVQRPVKFVKYLRQFGWEPTVLMAANPSVPVLDESLCRDIPEGVVIDKARTWEPGYSTKARVGDAAGVSGTRSCGSRVQGRIAAGLRRTARTVLQPDPQILWVPAAYRAALRRLKSVSHDAIFATAPSYSNLVLGALLKRRTGLPLILDFRDEWDISQEHWENSGQDRLSRSAQRCLQRWVLSRADHIVATTRGSALRLLERTREAGGGAGSSCIYNGFDPADFVEVAGDESRKNDETRFRLVYTGTLWNLADVSPLVRAVEALDAQSPELAARLELVLVGRKTEQQQRLTARLEGAHCRVEALDYCEHREALQWMASADALCLLLSDVAGAERVVPAKLFEYLGLRKPVLAIVPDGETAEIACRFHGGSHFMPRDVEGIADWLRRRLENWPAASQVDVPDADEFTREHLTGELAGLLDAVVERRGGEAAHVSA